MVNNNPDISLNIWAGGVILLMERSKKAPHTPQIIFETMVKLNPAMCREVLEASLWF
jgi:hypothetical protein